MPDSADTTPPLESRHRLHDAAWHAGASLWAGVIFAASALPGSAVPGRFGPAAHFAEYAVFAALLGPVFIRRYGRAGAALLALSVACAYAATDELHQAFVVMRTPDVIDWLVDSIGALSGATAALALSRRRSAQRSWDRSPSDGS